jgi:hypothetical protein
VLRRHRSHQLARRSRYWLGQLTHASDDSEIAAMLIRGGAHAHQAWALLVWWQGICTSDFRSKQSLLSRPFWLALDSEIPTRLGDALRSTSGGMDSDTVHLWLVRWIGAAGLWAFLRTVRDAVLQEDPPALSVAVRPLTLQRRKPQWSLGINANQELILCIDC